MTPINIRTALIVCAVAFVVTAAIGPSVIRYLRKMKFGQKILEIGPKWHMNKQNIPTMGGFMFIIGIAAAVLAGTLVNRFAHVNIDGWVGLAVAVFILRSGWGAAKATINPLLGESPDPELVKQLRDLVLSHPQVVGMHDLIIHDYGPGRRLCSFHAEVPQDADILDAHDAIDHIEREIKEKFGIETTVHMDPIATADEKVNQLRRQVADLARVVEPEMTIHDFRVVRGPTHTNVIFDAVVPHKCRLTDEEVLQRLRQAVSALDPAYQAVIQIDRAYVE